MYKMPKYLKSFHLNGTKTRNARVSIMKKLRSTIVTLAVLFTISMSFSVMYGIVQANQSADLPIIQPERINTSVPLAEDLSLKDDLMFEYDYGINATASINRSIEIQTFGVLSLVDSIKLEIVGNVNLTYFNYTLPNIHTNNITHAGFRVSNESYEAIANATSVRSYTYQKMINYTTFIIPLHVNRTSFGQGQVIYINSYLEFAYPYSYWIEGGEQVLHYEELIYPLINNIPIINGSVWVQKQGGDVFLTDRITPSNGTHGIYNSIDTEQGVIKWRNITRSPFNYSQSYDEDVFMDVYLTAVAAGGDIETPANTMLFKATEINRKIEVDPYGLIKITEQQNLYYFGPERPEEGNLYDLKLWALNSFPVILPINATVLDLYDEIGSLNQKYQLNDDQFFEPGSYNQRPSVFIGHDALVIFPRSPLFNGDEFSFTIVYTVPMEVYFEKEQGTLNYKMRFEPCSIINWTVEQLNVDLVLPKGAVYHTISYYNPDPYQDMTLNYEKKFKLMSLGFKRILSFSFTTFTGNDNARLTVEFTYSRLNVLITYFLQALTVGIVFAIYLGIRWSTKKTKDLVVSESERELIPVEEIEEFVKQYEEVLSIQERLRETRGKVAAKKMKAKEGKDLIAKLETRLRAEEANLKLTKDALVKFGGRYKQSVQKIEIAERKLYEERRNLRILQQEYRVKKTSMTRESYVKMFQDRQQTIEKLRNDIDAELLYLRMLLEP